ncbi:MAG: acyl-CoA dehydrogenase family protein, partial [Acidimicrobiia bacterium]
AVASAEMAGAMARAAEMTARYVAERQQFGRPIAAFQVVAHGAARLATLAEGATWIARTACRSPEPEVTHAAKGWISRASAEAAALAHQLHGAIGFTEEYGLQRLTKRLRTLRFAWGDDATHHLALGRLRAGG